MFGASEDRARQLAGRQRWKRISSSGSNSSYRSASSSSQLSQRETSSIFEHNIQRPSVIPEHHTNTADDLLHGLFDLRKQNAPGCIPASGLEEILAQMTAEDQHPHAQQQRSQAEHLSHVLYNDTAIADDLPLPSGCSILPHETKSYGVLKPGPAILKQIRYMTAPVLPVSDQSVTSSAHGSIDRSTSASIAHAQMIVSLRGGAGDEPFGNSTPPPWLGTPSWLDLAQTHPCWIMPFNNGPDYEAFFDSLSPTQAEAFSRLFSSHLSPEPEAFRLSRRVFEKQLSREQRQSFVQMLTVRIHAMLGPKLDQILGLNETIRLPSLPDHSRYPVVCMPPLVDALLPVPEKWVALLDPLAVAR